MLFFNKRKKEKEKNEKKTNKKTKQGEFLCNINNS